VDALRAKSVGNPLKMESAADVTKSQTNAFARNQADAVVTGKSLKQS